MPASPLDARQTRETLPGMGGFLHPERIMPHLELKSGMTVADFGCGGGYFSIPSARLVGEKGKVYAIDIQKQVFDLIRSKANLEHLLQIEPIWADLELVNGSRLSNASVDLVIVANILFQAEKKRNVLAEAWRILRPSGRLAILEWDETPFPAGPPPALRISRNDARRLAEEIGFAVEKEFDAGSHHYGLLLKKQ